MGKIVQWNYQTGETKVIGNFKNKGGAIVKFSPNGLYLAFASVDGTLKIGKCQQVESKCQLTENSISTPNQIYTLSFSSNEQVLAIAGGEDETIKIFSVNQLFTHKGLNSKQELYLLAGHTGLIADLKFFQNYPLLASVSGDKTLIIWQYENSFNYDNPLKDSCDFLKDYLNNNSVPDWFESKEDCS